MPNRTVFIRRTILAATIVVLLGACVMGTPILSPMDISLLGAGAAKPLKWPFETTPQTLELECGAERIVINVSPEKARVTLSDSTGELERDSFTSPKLRYFRMTRVAQYEHELILTEGGVDEFKTDWLMLHLDGSAELYYEDISYSCRVEGQ